MKKLLLQILLFAAPILAFAQKSPPPPLFQDFDKKVVGISRSFKFDDHLNIMQINTDNQNFDLIAVDDAMNLVWRSTFKGYALAAGKFKDKIVIVSSTEHSSLKDKTILIKPV